MKPYAWVVVIAWVMPALGIGLAHLLLPDHNASGQCEGIGFGCQPTPADSVLVLGVLASPVLLISGVVAMVVIAIWRVRRSAAQRNRGE